MTQSIEQDLRGIRLLVELDFVTPELVASWADTVIEREESPAPEFIDLSLAAASRSSKLLDALEDFSDAPSLGTVWEPVLEWTAARVRSGELEPGNTIRRIWAITSSSRVEIEKLENRFSILEDAYACARDGIYGSITEVRNDLLETLDEFGRPGALSRVAG